MRIGILTSVHPPMDTRIYFKQARSLQHAGHEVYLVARVGGDPRDVHYVPVRAPRSRSERFATIFQVFRRALALRCDVYHLHDPELLPVGVVLKILTRARLIYDVHENVREQIRNKYWIAPWLRGTVSLLYGLAERICLRWVDHVVLAEESYRSGYRIANVTVVRNYPILPAATLVASSRGYSDKPMLGYCGVVAEIRGALQMVEILGHVRRVRSEAELHVVGPCLPEDLGQRMRALAVELGVEDGLHLYGRLPLDEALELVGRCDIGLALLHPDPNYLESLPTKMFEYMSLRMPVVVSHFPLWKSIVDSSGGGLAVDPLDARGVAAAIVRLCADHELVRRMGERGRQAVLERYSWTAEERRLLEVYAGFGAANASRGVPGGVTRDAAVSTPSVRGRSEVSEEVGAR